MKSWLASILLICAGAVIAADDYLYHFERGTGPLVPQNASASWDRFPFRAFGPQTVNLTGLIEWWKQADKLSRDKWALYGSNYLHQLAPRPLTAWYRIYGDKISEDAFGWIVQAWIETAPGFSRQAKIQLRHPPAADEKRFNELQSALAQLKRLAGQNGLPRWPVHLSTEQYGDGRLVTNWWVADPVLHAQAQPIWAELDKIPISGTNYHIDFFAAKIGYLQDGSHREVFDLGQIRYPTH
ncbi:MAG: hypothetical protein ACLQU4_16415 [Limisphaerales bacterium]|jgi:hypothetical protein